MKNGIVNIQLKKHKIYNLLRKKISEIFSDFDRFPHFIVTCVHNMDITAIMLKCCSTIQYGILMRKVIKVINLLV